MLLCLAKTPSAHDKGQILEFAGSFGFDFSTRKEMLDDRESLEDIAE